MIIVARSAGAHVAESDAEWIRQRLNSPESSGGRNRGHESSEQTLAAALKGLSTLVATSSRDWAVHRVDAWIWAVLCGWDCEETEHDDTCVHGALEELAETHGWDTETVTKLRRHRAAVRSLTNSTGPQTRSELPRMSCLGRTQGIPTHPARSIT